MTKTILFGIVAVTFLAGMGTVYAAVVVTIENPTIIGDLICNDCIHATDIAPNAVGLLEMQSNAIGNAEMRNNAIGTSEIADNSITEDDIGNNAVGPFEIQTNAVRSSEIADNAVRSSEIADNAVTASEIAGGAVGFSEIDVTITTWDATGQNDDTDMIPVDGKSFCALLKVSGQDADNEQCDIDFGGLPNWQLQARNGVTCQAICIQFG